MTTNENVIELLKKSIINAQKNQMQKSINSTAHSF